MDESSVYAPLKNHKIRLLHVKPGVAPDIIKCTIEITDLTTKPCYEALSYEWGDDEPEWEIIVDERPVAIRDNLRCALQHIRDENDTIVLRIDALCINQGDLAERNHQVAQMGSIYAQAARVIAWIGRQNHSSLVDDSRTELYLNYWSDLGRALILRH